MSKIRLPAKPESHEKFLDFISRAAEKKGFSAKRVKEVELAAEEVLVNIYSYAYPENPGDVEIRDKENDGTKLILEIRDRGTPFDPLSISDPELSAHLSDRKVGGLGVFFMRKMADDLRYHRNGDANVLTLTFSSHGSLQKKRRE